MPGSSMASRRTVIGLEAGEEDLSAMLSRVSSNIASLVMTLIRNIPPEALELLTSLGQ